MMDDPAVFIHRICLEKGCACVAGAHVCADAITACSDDTPPGQNVPDAQSGTSKKKDKKKLIRKLNQVPDRLRAASVIVFLCRA